MNKLTQKEMDDHDLFLDMKKEAVFALKQLLEYAKYLEDNKQLSYALLKARVETYEKGE